MRSSVSCPIWRKRQWDLPTRRIYQTTLPREMGPLRVAIHVRGDPQRFAVRLRELAQAPIPRYVIDPKPLPWWIPFRDCRSGSSSWSA